jgi:hypothetical protein
MHCIALLCWTAHKATKLDSAGKTPRQIPYMVPPKKDAGRRKPPFVAGGRINKDASSNTATGKATPSLSGMSKLDRFISILHNVDTQTFGSVPILLLGIWF